MTFRSACPPMRMPPHRPTRRTTLLAEGYAEGLLTSDGRPAPAIAAAVRAMTPVARLVDVILTASPVTLREGRLLAGFEGVRDARAADALATRARIEASRDPDLANELLDLAISCGADAGALSLDRARAAWVQGRLDDAGVVLDGQLAQEGRRAGAADGRPRGRGLGGARHDVARRRHLSSPPTRRCPHGGPHAGRGRRGGARAARGGRLSHAEFGRRPQGALRDRHRERASSTAGLVATLENRSDEAMAALQRASELYTASRR